MKIKWNRSPAEILADLQENSTPDIDELISVLGQNIPLLYELKNTAQDPEWHAEGDVHIHTGMVLKALYDLLQNDASHITGERRQALILGALLHDICKPLCTSEREIKGIVRIVSPHHEASGRSYLPYRLASCGFSTEVIRMVLGLVGEHHQPKLLVIRNSRHGDYLRLSQRADCELLYWLEVADMKGRICPDLSTQLEYLELFRMFCEEYKIWNPDHHPLSGWETIITEATPALSARSRSLINHNAFRDFCAGYISTPEEALARSYAYRDKHSHLIIMCGPSGSGKSLWIKEHGAAYQVISLDEIREEIAGKRSCQKYNGQVIQTAKERLKSCLREGKNVIWDATSLRQDLRKQICDFGFSYHALVTIVAILKPLEDICEGNRNRQHPVPEDVLEKQLTSMEWPTEDEAHELKIVRY